MERNIPFSEFKKIVTAFAERKQYGYEKTTVKNLLIKQNEKTGIYEEGSFMGHILSIFPSSNCVDQDIYCEAMAACVKGYVSVKDSAIDIFRRLTGDIAQKSGVEFSPDYPPIPISNTFERLMFISKYLQDPKNKISELEDKLWVRSRTIEGDLAKLRGKDDDPIQICGKRYVIRDMTRENDAVCDMASTPHPFFLTCNLTQVIVTLKGLKEMSKNAALNSYAMKTAGEIWEQLSDYAKERIQYVMKNLMPDEVEWYQGLARSEKNQDYGEESFWPEYRCSSFGTNAILDGLKNGFPCNIEYQTEEGSQFYKDVIIKKFYGEQIIVKMGDAEITLELKKVLRSSRNKEELF